MLSNLNNYMPIILISMMFIMMVCILALTISLVSIKKKLDEVTRSTYMLIRKNDICNSSQDEVKSALVKINNNIKTATDGINDNIGSLSSSTKEVISELKQQASEPYLPTPNISKMMRETIQEYINMEVLLSHNMKLPNKESTQHIIDGVIQTYPNVDKNYTVKLCLAMIENFTLNSQGK